MSPFPDPPFPQYLVGFLVLCVYQRTDPVPGPDWTGFVAETVDCPVWLAQVPSHQRTHHICKHLLQLAATRCNSLQHSPIPSDKARVTQDSAVSETCPAARGSSSLGNSSNAAMVVCLSRCCPLVTAAANTPHLGLSQFQPFHALLRARHSHHRPSQPIIAPGCTPLSQCTSFPLACVEPAH